MRQPQREGRNPRRRPQRQRRRADVRRVRPEAATPGRGDHLCKPDRELRGRVRPAGARGGGARVSAVQHHGHCAAGPAHVAGEYWYWLDDPE